MKLFSKIVLFAALSAVPSVVSAQCCAQCGVTLAVEQATAEEQNVNVGCAIKLACLSLIAGQMVDLG